MARVSYDAYVKHTAFLLWFEVCNRDVREVARTLETDEVYREQAGLLDRDESPGWRTIKSWEREEFWDLKAADLMREAAPWRAQVAGIRMAYNTQKAAEVIEECLAKPKLEKSDEIRLNNAWRLINSTVADSVSTYLKPKVEKALKAKDLTTLADIRAAELEALRETNTDAE